MYKIWFRTISFIICVVLERWFFCIEKKYWCVMCSSFAHIITFYNSSWLYEIVCNFLTTKGLCFFNSTLEVSFQRSIFQGETVRLHTYVLQNTICVFSLLKNFSLFLFFLSVSFFITLVSKKKMPSVETVTMDIFFLKSILFCHTYAHVAEVVLTQTSALIYLIW